MEKVQNDAGIPKEKQLSARSIEETNWMSDQLPWMLPIVIMVIIWIVMMRRMGGGGSGGPGQIFNIGKSKATLFDKDTHVNITFNDVAGLDGAKMEVMEIVDFPKESEKIYRPRRKDPERRVAW
jgi:AFG3 family protein